MVSGLAFLIRFGSWFMNSYIHRWLLALPYLLNTSTWQYIEDSRKECSKHSTASHWNSQGSDRSLLILGTSDLSKFLKSTKPNWWFPEIGVLPNHPFLDGIFPLQTIHFGVPPIYGNPQIGKNKGDNKTGGQFSSKPWSWFLQSVPGLVNVYSLRTGKWS